MYAQYVLRPPRDEMRPDRNTARSIASNVHHDHRHVTAVLRSRKLQHSPPRGPLTYASHAQRC